MKILPANQIPSEIVATPIDDPVKLYKLYQEMKKACVENDGKGLSAVQVGIPWNLFVVIDMPTFLQTADDTDGCFIDCQYTPVGDQLVESIEGCLSLTNDDGSFRRFRLNRHTKVRVRGKRLIDLQVVDFDQILDIKHDTIVFQHEIDHANQILVSNRGKEILLW